MSEDHIYGTAVYGVKTREDPRFQRLIESNPWMKEDHTVDGNQIVVFPQGREILGLQETGLQVGPFHPLQWPLIAFRVFAYVVIVTVVVGGVIILVRG